MLQNQGLGLLRLNPDANLLFWMLYSAMNLLRKWATIEFV